MKELWKWKKATFEQSCKKRVNITKAELCVFSVLLIILQPLRFILWPWTDLSSKSKVEEWTVFKVLPWCQIYTKLREYFGFVPLLQLTVDRDRVHNEREEDDMKTKFEIQRDQDSNWGRCGFVVSVLDLSITGMPHTPAFKKSCFRVVDTKSRSGQTQQANTSAYRSLSLWTHAALGL